MKLSNKDNIAISGAGSDPKTKDVAISGAGATSDKYGY